MQEVEKSGHPKADAQNFDICALGEILIDFTPAGIGPQGNPCFERNPGGAPANVLAFLSRLGRSTALIAKLGTDMFGSYLLQLLNELGIDNRAVTQDPETRTTLAFVQLDSHGERSFSFYRNPGADIMLEPEDLDFDLIEHSRIFHCGSLSLTNEPAASATWAALGHAAKSGCVISYDPNLRPALWSDLGVAREKMVGPLGHCDILKISEEELAFLTGISDLKTGTARILDEWKVPVILVTRGARGIFYRLGPETGERSAFTGLDIVDTTGAGDTFLAAFLYCILCEADQVADGGGCAFDPALYGNAANRLAHKGEAGNPVADVVTCLSPARVESMIDFAAAAAGLCATKRGAIPSLPDLTEIQKLLRRSGRPVAY